MGYGLQIVAPPAAEPITLDEAKGHLRVTLADDDDEISEWITAAREFLEEELGIVLIETQFDLFLDRPPTRVLELPRWPLVRVDSVTYLDAAGVSQVWDAAQWEYDATRQPGRLYPAYGQVWPVTRVHPQAVTIRLTAGYESAADVPKRARSALKLIMAHFYEHREEIVAPEGVRFQELPLGAQRLMAQLAAGTDFTEFGDDDG